MRVIRRQLINVFVDKTGTQNTFNSPKQGSVNRMNVNKDKGRESR